MKAPCYLARCIMHDLLNSLLGNSSVIALCNFMYTYNSRVFLVRSDVYCYPSFSLCL